MYIVTCRGCDYRRGLDWRMDLLATCTHHSELQVITALSLISTFRIHCFKLYYSLHYSFLGKGV
jgi:hypothetical protein